ncbi:MAG TPA: non-ribosomal peptide synthase/polyketide synthase, partial [Thermoanaerobaculia bacterium]|nr:non-ribosomal peptide synthase/polyketide synthase [Thermoanaerobaculia bacterium]
MSFERVHELFAVRAAETPEALAVAGPGLRLTYRELDLRAGRLARRLVALGVGPEVPVAVLAGRSPEALVAILAVLKAGGCYLPLDPAYPEERLAWILADSGASVLLTQGPVSAGAAVRVVRLDEEIAETEDGPELPRAAPGNLAYVIYTSGSTGRPKGVEVEHRGLANLAAWHRRAYGITAAARATRLAGSAFDASVWEVWPYLTAGASLHIPDDETVLQPPRLARWLAGEGITHTFLPTPLAEAFLDEPWPADAPLVALLTGGDRLHRRPRPEHAFGLFNHYGPTENSVVTTWGRVETAGEGMPSIGRPIDGVEVVLDEAGELLIGGVGLARGYRGRPDLTAERFVPAAEGRRLYRTGDLARFLPSGELDFIGRIDFQVKIRGFRIELGEIEAVLRRHPAVREGVVVAREDGRGGKALAGYVVGDEVSAAELRAFLSRDLPDYMVPAAWVFLDALPLTPNGKVDRAALPAPEIAEDAYVAPRTETEAAVAEIFAEVLGLAKAGAGDDFFALGGHSLSATQVLSRVRSRLGVDLPPRALFDHPTVAALAQKAGSSRETAGEDWEIRPVPRPDAPVAELPASFSQQGLWLADRLERGVPLFNTPFAFELSGPLDVSALARALAEIVRRHEPLRTTFREEGGRLWQRIARPAPVPLPVVDLSGLPRAAREREAERWTEAEARRPLDPSREPMLQLRVLRLGPGEHVLLALMHHIVSDDWSLWVFVSELAALYAAFSAGRPSPLPEPSLGYGDFAVWQRQWLQGARLEQEIDWWRARLQPPLPVLDLPADHPRPAVRSWRGARLHRVLPAELAAGLSALGRGRDASLFIVLLAAFDVLLSRLTASLDVLVGSPIANRHRIEVEGLIGYFVNMLALRGDLAGNPRFGELVLRLRETVLAAYGHQDVPFGLLVEELASARDLSRSPLTDVYLILGNAPRPPGELAPGLRLALRELETGTVQGDLTLHLAETGDGISAVWGYSLDLFDAATAERMASGFETLLAGIVAAPAARLADLPLLSPAERAQLLAWGENPLAVPQGLCLHQVFETWVDRAPDDPAIEWVGTGEDGRLTYRELDEAANRLAWHLIAQGVGPEVWVGLSLPRSVDMIVALFAVLKSGGAYVPLDPSLPAERLAFMAAETRPRVVVTQQSLHAEAAAIAARPASRPAVSVDPDNAAYAIFTSGSTGRPKGVVIPHVGLPNLAEAVAAVFGMGPGDRALLFAPLTFDTSLFEILAAFRGGATLCIAGQDDMLPGPGLLRLLREKGITRLTLTPSALASLDEEELPGVVSITVAGEACTADLVERWGRRHRFFNCYGPTEHTVWASVALCTPSPRRPPIGRPVANKRFIVLDPDGNPVPAGVPGELWVGGVGPARGYLNRPDLTAERFRPDPFAAEPGARAYRTGDLVRWLPDGQLDFLGRNDFQVKVRGFRIELGEIESVLAAHPAVRDAVVLARNEGQDRRLVGYVVARSGAAPTREELRAHLGERLPEYMVPAAWVFLDALPLTASDKVDRQALALVAPAEDSGRKGGAVPRTPIEEGLAGIFAELLGLPRVDVQDDFFALGGHSLLAAQVLSRVHRLFGVELPVRALFERPTVEALARRIEEAQREAWGPEPPLGPRPRDGALPLSFGQERLWIADQLSPGQPVYNIPLALFLRGPLAVPALGEALAEIVRRHEALRTTFTAVAGDPVQVISPPGARPLPVADLAGLPEGLRRAEAGRLVHEEALRPFDLSRGPLVRWALVRLAGEEHRLLLSFHHIVADGWSLGVLFDEIAALYGAFAAGRPSPLPELPIQLPDFALWQREWLADGVLDAQLAWWRERLGNDLPVLELPTDRPHPAVPSSRGATERLILPADLADGLRDLSRQRGATFYMTLLAAFDALLGRLAGQDVAVVGSPVANRNRAELERLIGFFVNTVVLRGDLAGDPGFVELVGRVREEALGAWAHQDVPFDKLVEALAPERNPSRSPLFQVSFGFEEAPRPPLPLAPGLTLEAEGTATDTAKFDLSLFLQEVPGGLGSAMEYATDLFDAATVRRMLGHLATLLAGAVSHPEARISDLPLLSAAERRELEAWNAGLRLGWPRPEEATVRDLFDAQAARTPDAPAVIAADEALSYAGLRGRALRIAARLHALGIGPEVPVGVYCDRTPGLVAAFVAVMEAGGVYVPLDPSYPPDRISFMVEDAGCAVVLAEAALPEGVAEGVPVLAIDGPGGGEPFVPPALAPQNLAYVIYTSGSTGNPKRVGVSHGAAAAQGIEAGRYYGLGPGDRFLLFASPSFDVSIENLMGPLLSGAALVPRGPGLPAPEETTRRIAEEEITVVNFAPAYWAEWVRSFEGAGSRPASLRLVIVGGDEMPGEAVRLLRRTPLADVRLLNVYGPTEAVVTATMEEVLELPDALPPVLPVGRLIPGRSAHVLDRHGNLLPVGVPGEAALGGLLARGYLGHPALTALRFVPDPFSGEPGARLYRTGDLLRRRPEGGFDFLGRVDRQVKIRGVRVEPGEIEAALLRHPGIAGAAVGVRSLGGEKSLVAWVVPREGVALSPGDLRADLAARLPAFLVPAAFAVLEAFPLTPNGKVDRRALPAPELEERAAEGLAAPRTPAEELLAGVWSDLLGAGPVGVDQDFFALGGHSLLATRLVSRIRDLFGVELPLRALFEAPTIAALAARIAAEEKGPEAPPVLPRRPGERLLLSSGQERLWILDRLAPGTAVYNMPLAFRLRGALALEALADALSEVVRRHEALRTTFERIDGEPVQAVSPPAPFPLPVLDLSELPEEERDREAERLVQEEALRPFDLRRGPLFRAALLKLAPEEHRLLLTMHHIVSDGWSLGLLLREISALYEGTPLPEPAVQYPDFALWQRRWLDGGVLSAQLSWWRERLGGDLPVLEMPADRPRPATPSRRGAEERLDLPADLAGRLRELSRRQGSTLYMTLLAAFDALLYRYTGQDDLLVGSPVAGRNRAEVEGTIGFFVNTLVLRAGLSGDPGFSALLAQVREAVLGAWAHQDVPFERLVLELAPERDLSRSPLFQVSLTVESAPPPPLALGPGLTVSAETVGTGSAKFDLSAGFQDVPEGLVSLLEYAADLFDAATIRRMLGHLATLLEGLVARPAARISELPLLSAPEREAIAAWNGGLRQSRPLPEETTLRDLFEAQAARTPGAPAIVTPEETVSYAVLRSRALRIAARLQALGVGPEVPVGVWCDRTAGLITAFVAVLEAGGVYVPLDPSYPPDRIAFMVGDAGCAVLLAEGEAPAALADRLPVLRIAEAGEGEAGPFAPPALAPQNLAYVIYTSGSTGTPKRVGVPHGPAATQGIEAGRYYGLGPGDRFLLFVSPSFDVSVENLMGPLLSGAALVPRGAELPAPVETTRRIAELAVTVVNFAPAYWIEWVKSFGPGDEAPPTLRLVIVGGDEMPGEVVRLVRNGPLGHVRLLNVYGPTEAVVTATMQEVLELPLEIAGAAPVGRLIPGRSAHALDRDGNPVPVGVPGEMYLGGLLARGYLNHPALTAERFGPDPFSGLPGARLYRTGDLVRRRPDGAFEFAGRADHQVKIRGFRVEPGEVEAAVLRHPDVESAVVAVRSDGGEKRLVAYVIPREGRAADLVRDLRADLVSRLPAFMVPAAFVLLSAFPMTPNGKVDRRALPAPGAGARDAGRDRVAPSTPTELLLARAWADLLGTAAVFADDHFFELGGHSLLATRLVSRVREVFDVELPLKAVFESPVLKDLAAKIDEAGLAGRALGTPDFLSGKDGQALPLSFSQQRLWFLDRLEPGTAVYNLPSVFRLRGELGIPALAAALSSIVRRHEVLRTTYGLVSGDPVQAVHPPAALPLPVVDLGALSEGAREAESARLVGEEARRPFSLAQGPVLRAALVRLAGGDHRLLLSLHHIAGDGWSLGILLRELAALYGAALEGRPSPLPELPLQYADFALWQRRWLEGGVLEAQLAFWREALAGCPLVLELPADRPRPAVQSHRGAAVETALSADLSSRLEALSRERGATLFMTLLAAAGALLHRYTGEPDLLVGTPVANRNRAETEPLIGFFVNSLALRASFGGDPSFVALLDRTRETALAAYDHQDLPFERLVEELAPQRDLTRAPIFQVSFTLGRPLADGSGLAPGLSLESEAVDLGVAKLDLTLGFEESARGLAAGAEYATDLFDETTVRRLLGHLENLLAGIAASPEARVSELPLLSAAERDEIAAANAGLPHGRLQPEETTVRDLFAAQVERTPGAPALVTGDGVLSYADLRARALRIAARLQALGVGPEVPVGVYCDRTPGLVLAFAAVIEAGGVYVPLDPSAPPERTAFLVEDARCAAVLAETDPPAGVADRVPVLAIDGETEAAGPFVPPALDPGCLAYVIYTSGSTGAPKRVGVSHGAAAAHAAEAGRCYGLGPGDRFLLFHGPAFDPSLENLMAPLVSGAALVPRGAELPSPAEMTRRIEEQGITAVNFAPVYWIEWARSFEGASTAPPSLRLVIVGGEEMPGRTVRLLAETPLRHVRLVNVYAPTEAVITSNVLDVWSLGGDIPRAVPLGPPIPGRSSYVLDSHGNPLPLGAPGEMVLGGLLARGYLDQPALTAERFVPDPFSGRPGARLYRTGDQARRRADGAFDFVGRTDHQVKIRGYRVEPGEVEAAVLRHPRVAAAAVVAAPHGSEKRLVAYAVPRPGESLEAGELQADVAERLPSHMVPSAVVILPALPLTPNGKVDRRALPAPEWDGAREDRLAPRTPGEELLARAWAEVLRLETVDVRDNFFELGGHSLLATRLVSRIRDLFGVELPLRALFEAPTVEALAARIEAEQLAGAEVEAAPVSSGRREAELPLSFAQQRLWFLEQLQPGNAAYNLPAILRLGGALSVPALEAALSEIVRRHEVLRTVFTVVQGEARQVVGEPSLRPLPVVDLSGLPEPAREAEAFRRMEEEVRSPFDLRQGPVLRETLLRLAAEDHRLLLIFHHIAADGWSIGVLLEELGALYDCARSGRPSPLPELPLQYADFALWQRRWLAGGALEAQLAFWREALRGCPLALDLPADRPRPAVRSQRGAAESAALPAGLSLRLEALSHEGRATLFMTLLAAFGALLARYTGEPDLLVGSPVAGRTRGEIEPLIGFFVNTLALRIGFAAETTFSELLGRTRETALAAYAHQDLPFERLVEELAPERDLSRTPIVQVSFSLAPSAIRNELAPGLSLANETVDLGTAKFDLTLAFEAGPEGLQGGAEYAADLFDAATVQRMLGHFATLLEGVAADPTARVSELPLLSLPEREQLLVDWNRTEAEFPRDVPIHRQLEAWAARTPDAPAVIAGSEILTYAGLNRRANRLARGLAARGVGPEVLVALDLERSPELVVAALAVLKAGGAYVPVNPRDPAERRRFILEEAGGIRLDRGALAGMERNGEDDLDVPVSGESLAYVIYTSGSTGRPKGVAIPHRGVSRLTAGAGYLGLGP